MVGQTRVQTALNVAAARAETPFWVRPLPNTAEKLNKSQWVQPALDTSLSVSLGEATSSGLQWFSDAEVEIEQVSSWQSTQVTEHNRYSMCQPHQTLCLLLATGAGVSQPQ